MRAFRSLWLRFAIIAAVMLAAPAIIYQQLLEADQTRNQLLRESVAAQGQLIAAGLTPAMDPARLPDLNAELARFHTGAAQVRLLFRPAGEADDAYFFVAAAPALPVDSVDQERMALLATGALDRIGPNCDGGGREGVAYEAVTGDRRVIASVAPVPKASGCWVVIITRHEVGRLGPAAQRSYWRTPEMIASGVIYVVMVGLVLLILLSVRQDLGRFAEIARRASEGGADARFRDRNRLPELDGVANAFDRMVASLRRSGEVLSRLAEENAHALKTPVGVIAQAVEPLRKAVADDPRRTRSVELIDRSVERLDHLISVIRRSEETAAALVTPKARRVNAASLIREVADAYGPIARDRGITIETEPGGAATLRADPELLRTAIENPLENALELTPEGGSVTLSVQPDRAAGQIEIRIADTGPGVPASDLEQIFERRFSMRKEGDSGHDGLGLWIVRRNMEAMGGTAHGEAVAGKGLVIVLRAPAA